MELTDLEICRKIADIEDIHYMETKYKGNANFIALVSENDFSGTPPEMIGKYDPLNDNALCFVLSKKYNVSIMHYEEYSTARVWGDPEDNPIADFSDINNGTSLNKAICLAIIEANK